jgi:hypothetical protein
LTTAVAAIAGFLSSDDPDLGAAGVSPDDERDWKFIGVESVIEMMRK